MSDRGFAIAFGVSLGMHLTFVVAHLPQWGWIDTQRDRPPLEVIYDAARAHQGFEQLNERLAKVRRQGLEAPAPSVGTGQLRVRIPERPLVMGEQTLEHLLPTRSAIVDLTNLVEAAQGNPVLLSYFSIIREQIQSAANRGTWTTGTGRGGHVYVSFVLSDAGVVHSATIVEARSVSSRALQRMALKIVRSAGPFPAFPPSLKERTKTIVVPLEFLMGS